LLNLIVKHLRLAMGAGFVGRSNGLVLGDEPLTPDLALDLVVATDPWPGPWSTGRPAAARIDEARAGARPRSAGTYET